MALTQILNSGAQSLVLNLQGAAVGGTSAVNAGSLNSSLQSLVVPQGVQLNSVGFNSGHPLNVSGSASILGSLYVLQSAPGLTGSLNIGANLNVGSGGLLSGYLPAGLNLPGVFASRNLNLNVANNFTNNGLVTVPGNLNVSVGGVLTNVSAAGALSQAGMVAQNINIVSGSGNIVNAGLMRALDTISIGSLLAGTNLILDNSNGTVQALNAINVRDVLFAGQSNVTMTGGDWLSSQLNINAGCGDLEVNVNSVSGLVNVHTGSAHIYTATDTLSLGNMSFLKDPVLYNALTSRNSGNIDLSGTISSAGNDLAILAAGSIRVASGTPTITTNGAGKGGNLWLIAGATLSGGAANLTTAQSQNCTNSYLNNANQTITVKAGNGGNVNLTGGSGTINTSGAAGNYEGGNVTIVAFASGTTGGQVNLPSGMNINAGGTCSGANGNVLIIAGSNPSPAVTTVTTSGISATGGSGGGGKIEVYSATPLLNGLSTGSVTLAQSAGGTTINQTNTITAGTLLSGNISGTSYTAGSSGLNVETSGSITTSGATSADGAINIIAGTGVSTGTITGGGASAPVLVQTSTGSISTAALVNSAVSANTAGGDISLKVLTVGTGNNITTTGAGTITSVGNGSGAGGAITLQSGNNITVTGTAGSAAIIATGGSTGAGGSVVIDDYSTSLFSLNSALNSNYITGTVSARGGATSGAGGSVTITQHGEATNGGIQLNDLLPSQAFSDIDVRPVSGSGGYIRLDASSGGVAPFGTITMPAGGILSGSAATSGSGGTVYLRGSQIASGSGLSILNAAAAGNGDGG